MFGTILQSLAVPLALVIGIVMMFVFFAVIGVDVSRVLSFSLLTLPLWLPFAIFGLTFEKWMYYVRAKFVYENGRSTLRIKLPQEVFKSPEAMEAVLNQAYNSNSVSNLMEAYLDGKHPLVLSLELVSIGGEVRFYINTPRRKVKNVVEAQLYAHYPGIEVVEELVDYASEIKWDPDTMALMSFHIGKKDDEVLPIKTYVDFGLDKLPKEEEKLDPMSPIIELLSKVKPNDRLWIQFLLKPHAKENPSTGSLSTKETWEKAGAKKIDEIMKRDKSKSKGDDEEDEGPARLTPGERGTIEAIERNMSKWAYETVVRVVYVATDKNKFDGDIIAPMLRSWSVFDMIGRNRFGFLWRTDFDYNFISDPTGSRRIAYKKSELEDYKKRYYYRADYMTEKDKPKVMSVEEIATMYHIPGKVVVTPGLSRIESLKREAPSNLPTGIPPHLQ